ncbi:DUF559 domain-containing protein [Eggerthella sp. NSJ-70]|uniref:DUF559 domain-containing protein n=1 Tax=Eggerthella hominis TaxID=2763043 RepID=A0ABR7BTY0_9ACTN|nr:DUF559 domain-containing protein [Eggerthella hominis]MBC5585043.1 DUF559 domain-containing protein [Eggerthella hominis]
MGGSQVYFGFQSALQIARTIGSDDRVAVRGGMNGLPDKAPSEEELAEIVERLRSAYPQVRIDSPAHVLVSTGSYRRFSESCKEHVCSAPLAGRPFYRLSRNAYAAVPALALVQVASREQSEMSVRELAYELCGTYQTERTGVDSAYQTPPLASIRELRDFASRNSSVDGARKVIRMLRYAADGSASPRETKQALVLGLPLMYGGYGLGIPRMNYEVKASPAARAITGKSCFRCDLCWPEAKLDVEYQSRESHEGEASRISDSRRANALAAMGWTVIGVTNDELDSLPATDTIASTIRRLLGKRAQVRVANHHARKLKLRRQLGLPARYE